MTKQKRTAQTPNRRMSPFLLRGLLILLGIVVGAAIVEGTCRFLWTAPWYDKLLAEQRRVQRFNYNTNALGLRDRDYSPVKPEGVKRILMLGDSFTFGLGVPDDAKIFADILEERLNAMDIASAPHGVEVLNAGYPSTLTGDWVKSADKLVPQFKPDIVVIVFFLRDGTQVMFIPEYFMKIREHIVARNEHSFWYQHSYAWRIVRDNLDRHHVSSDYAQQFINAYFGNERETLEWQTAQRNLLHIRDVAAAHGAKTGMVIFPVLVQLNEHYPFASICDLLMNFAATHNMPALNLLGTFLGYDAPRLWVSPWDQHPNEEGHALTADAMLPFLVQMLEENKSSNR
jgi:lysophospholipase L1-like esterase